MNDAVWLADGEIVSFYGAPYPTRAVIVRLVSGELWIWSPIALTTHLRQAIDALGAVRHLVSPNKLHHLYLSAWKAAYPQAQLWGPRTTIKKRPDLDMRELVDEPPVEWRDEIDQAWFRGSFALDEIEFFHRASAITIIADLSQTFSEEFLKRHWGWMRFVARVSGITEAHGRAPIDWRASFIHRAIARRARDKVLSWACQQVIVAHGELPTMNGHEFLVQSLSWLGDSHERATPN